MTSGVVTASSDVLGTMGVTRGGEFSLKICHVWGSSAGVREGGVVALIRFKHVRTAPLFGLELASESLGVFQVLCSSGFCQGRNQVSSFVSLGLPLGSFSRFSRG